MIKGRSDVKVYLLNFMLGSPFQVDIRIVMMSCSNPVLSELGES